MAIEIVDFPMKNGGSFHCYVSSPEGNHQGEVCFFLKQRYTHILMLLLHCMVRVWVKSLGTPIKLDGCSTELDIHICGPHRS